MQGSYNQITAQVWQYYASVLLWLMLVKRPWARLFFKCQIKLELQKVKKLSSTLSPVIFSSLPLHCVPFWLRWRSSRLKSWLIKCKPSSFMCAFFSPLLVCIKERWEERHIPGSLHKRANKSAFVLNVMFSPQMVTQLCCYTGNRPV